MKTCFCGRKHNNRRKDTCCGKKCGLRSSQLWDIFFWQDRKIPTALSFQCKNCNKILIFSTLSGYKFWSICCNKRMEMLQWNTDDPSPYRWLVEVPDLLFGTISNKKHLFTFNENH